MPTEYVLDASAAAKLLLVEPETPAMRRWFEASNSRGLILVPPVFQHELRNVAAKGVLRHDVPDAQTAAAMCDEFRLMVKERPVSAAAAIALAVEHIVSTHDASYLALMGDGSALVTYDDRMAKIGRLLHGKDRVLTPR